MHQDQVERTPKLMDRVACRRVRERGVVQGSATVLAAAGCEDKTVNYECARYDHLAMQVYSLNMLRAFYRTAGS